jgi:hypothetical protein
MKLVIVSLFLLTFGWLTYSSRFVLRENIASTTCEVFDGSTAYTHGSWIERSKENSKKAARSGELFRLKGQQVYPQSKSGVSTNEWKPRDCDLITWNGVDSLLSVSQQLITNKQEK